MLETADHAMHAPPQRIGILGAFGIGNSGNEGTLETMLALVRRVRPGADLTCICNRPDIVASEHGIAAVPMHSRPDNRAFRILSKLLLKVPAALIDFVRALRQAASLDLMLVPGTGVLDDYSTGPMGGPYHIFKWCLAARICATPTAFVSVGAGPIPHPLSRWFLRHAAAMATYRSFRDANSKDFMTGIGLDTRADAIYPDLAFAIPADKYPSQPQRAEPATVGVGVMTYHGWRGKTDEGADIYKSYLEKISLFTLWLLDKGYRVRLLTGDGVDLSTADDVLRIVTAARSDLAQGSVRFEPVHSLHDVMRQISETDAVVATRFHNVVCALKLGRPTVSIGYSKKNDVLMAEMGLGDFCQHIERLDVELLTRQFDRLMADRDRYAEAIRETNLAFRERLGQQELVLARMLDPAPAGEMSAVRRSAPI